ncbi:MAG: hypothetical protein P8M80_14290, partial [Pirellulaceae bacterium]|nr:hypothetical protein [Pirellulaceae bacterium]
MSSDHPPTNKVLYLAQEFSIPLLLGVLVALIVANAAPKQYQQIVHHTYDFLRDNQNDGPAESDSEHGASDSKTNHADDEHENDEHENDEHENDEHENDEHENDEHGG